MDITITSLMHQHHQKINNLLKSLLDGFGMDKSDMRATYRRFAELLEEHMRTEEQVIFTFCGLGGGETQRIIGELLSDHARMRNIIGDINGNFEVNFGVNIGDLQKILFDHESKENVTLYPKLDAEIDEAGKRFIFKKLGVE